MAAAAKAQAAWEKPCGDGCLYEIVELFGGFVGQSETEWDRPKMEKQLRQYYIKAAKNIVFKNKPLETLINDYADNVAAAIFGGLGNTRWLQNDQDKGTMVLLLDAAIKDIFPGGLFKDIEQPQFEALVMAAYERSFDQQRFWPILTETIADFVSGPRIKKKVYNAIESGRKAAMETGTSSAEVFVFSWCTKTVESLAAACQQGPQEALEPERMAHLFLSMLASGALPASAKLKEGESPPTTTVEESIMRAYLPYAPTEAVLEDSVAGPGEGAEPAKPEAKEVETELPSAKRRKIMEALAKL